MANDIKQRLSEKLAEVNGLYEPKSAVQMRVSTEDLKALLAEGVPPGMQDLKAATEAEHQPTHIVLWREQVQQLLDYENRKKTT